MRVDCENSCVLTSKYTLFEKSVDERIFLRIFQNGSVDIKSVNLYIYGIKFTLISDMDMPSMHAILTK